MGEVSAEKLSALFDDFTAEAFRLETRDAYAMSYERMDFEKFLSGGPLTEPPEVDWWRPWLDMVADRTAAGKRVGRVRVLAEPPTDYQRWVVWGGQWNCRAGEDIRYIPRVRAQEIGLPLHQDWWLFDSSKLVILQFNQHDQLTALETITDPDVVGRHCEWRDLAVRNSSPIDGELAA